MRMITTIFLWINMILFAAHLFGHLHNSTVNVPNWSDGTPDDLVRYTRFYHRKTNTSYFAPVIFSSIATSLLSLILVWNNSSQLRLLAGIDLLIAAGTLVSVLTLFKPINDYFQGGQYEAGQLSALTIKWLRMNRLRIVFVAAGFAISIWMLNI